ncbi:MAG: hypothetical protein IJO20_06005 [Ruminococcus sp.]|nr:hypothetical protein [Ruminococcus sp.]MBQ7134031.1 hypothetical protein [Ruminococcus sp.]
MKSKLFSSIALLVSVVAFFASVAFLVYKIQNKMPYTTVIIQLVLTGVIVLLCVVNFIYLFTTDHKDNDEDK